MTDDGKRRYIKGDWPRLPAAERGWQYNACPNPACVQFAVPPRYDARGPARIGTRDIYTIGARGIRNNAARPSLRCRSCGTAVGLISNAAVVEEFERLTRLDPVRACPNADCDHASRPLDRHPEAYIRFGASAAGTPRYRCRACGRTLSTGGRASLRLRRPEKTEEVLRLLINKVPMRRLCAIASIGPELLYQRMSLLHERLGRFARRMEIAFRQGPRHALLRIASDRQDHSLAWGSAADRQVFELFATCSADTITGYVLAQHVNYDPDQNAMTLELRAREVGDPERPPAHRRYARLWLPYEAGLADGAPEERASFTPQAFDEVRLGLAGRGAYVHSTYTLMAHFLVLSEWGAVFDRIHVSMDRENAIDRAFMVAFAPRVTEGSADAFLVRMSKSLTVAKRQLEVARLRSALDDRCNAAPELSERHVIRRMLAERYQHAVATQAEPRQRWIAHPMPSMQEPSREILGLTTAGRSTEDIVVGLSRATLRAIDRYFMQVRRKLSLLERPIESASTRRTWHGYAAYSPRVVTEILEIFRVVYNFHLVGNDGRTPAQRLGVTDRAWSLTELIDGAYESTSGKK